jgi:hypothetical protein
MLRPVLSFLLSLLLAAAPGAALADDATLAGYVTAWLAHVHRLGPDRVQVSVERGVVTLSGTADSPEQIDRILASVAAFEGVAEVVSRLRSTGPAGVARAGRWRTWMEWLEPPAGRKTIPFPVGDLFTGPLADPKQPRFHSTYQHYHLSFGAFNIASVGFGETFGLLRWPREREGDGWQLGLGGAVFAIFNLDASSKDLLNADYVIGMPWSYRSGEWSGRLRYYHQSSHLGDEFLLEPQAGPPVTRINLSYEALEILGSWERRGLRVYGGGSRIVSTDTPLARDRTQVGVEYRGAPTRWRTARIVAGFDVQSWDETGWDRDKSFKAGLQFRSPYGGARSLQVLLEYYEGHLPHGQFYPRVVESIGFGIAYPF